MDIQTGNPQHIWLLLVVAIVTGLALVGMIARRRALAQFAAQASRQSATATQRRTWLSALLTSASLALLAVALIDVRWGKTWQEVPQKGIEVVFALDVSRSMLAEDASPNRLARAKQQIKDLVDAMAGDRVGLVVFAGDSRQMIPLTSHHDDFKQVLDEVGPRSVRRGGSKLALAIQAAADAFIDKTNDHKAVVIFTDGEDQESDPVKLAKQLHNEQGIRIFTVGLGDMDQGARIPQSAGRDSADRYVEYQGTTVWSKMNGRILRDIATSTNGAYIPAGTKRVNMADVYHGYVANVEQTEFETAKINGYIPRFQWFALPALLLLLAEAWMSTAARRSRTARVSSERRETDIATGELPDQVSDTKTRAA